MSSTDVPAAERRNIIAVGTIVAGAILALAALRYGFRGAVAN